MGASRLLHNAVFALFCFAGDVCDELATACGIHRGVVRHKEFGDVSRHNLILNEMARHSGAGVGSSGRKREVSSWACLWRARLLENRRESAGSW